MEEIIYQLKCVQEKLKFIKSEYPCIEFDIEVLDGCISQLENINKNEDKNMGTIVREYETRYNTGDVVIFRKDNKLQVGIIEGYYIDNDIFWFNIRISKDVVYTYSNHGDVGEYDIIGIVDDTTKMICNDIITKDLF